MDVKASSCFHGADTALDHRGVWKVEPQIIHSSDHFVEAPQKSQSPTCTLFGNIVVRLCFAHACLRPVVSVATARVVLSTGFSGTQIDCEQ